jgi:hypothetical protein
MNSDPLADGMPSASSCSWFNRTDWRSHDSWMSGGPHLDGGIPYANIVWEAVGLRDRQSNPSGVPEWARGIRSFADLAEGYGILFFTDGEADAGRYGECLELDLSSDAIVDVIEDPHVRTHRGWIAIIRAGDPVPFVDPPAPKPR